MGHLLTLVPPETPPEAEPIIDLLRVMIDRARAGEITDIAIAAALPGEQMSTVWCGWSGRLIAPAQLLASRLMEDMRS